MPPGLSIVSVTEVAWGEPALATQFTHAVYEITLQGIAPAEVERRAADLMEQDEVRVEFRRKKFDLRHLVGDLALSAAGDRSDEVCLRATLLRDERGRIGRPDVLIQALELGPYVRQTVRQEMAFDR
jgi:hypothetical protein